MLSLLCMRVVNMKLMWSLLENSTVSPGHFYRIEADEVCYERKTQIIKQII